MPFILRFILISYLFKINPKKDTQGKYIFLRKRNTRITLSIAVFYIKTPFNLYYGFILKS